MNHPTVVSRAEWFVARKELRMKEKTSIHTQNMTEKKRLTLTPWRLAAGVAALLVAFVISPGQAQIAAQYPPLSAYLMPRDAEVASFAEFAARHVAAFRSAGRGERASTLMGQTLYW